MSDGKSSCAACYDHLYSEFCESCGLVIMDGQVAHGGQHWHATDSCFACHICSKSLVNQPFLPQRGLLFCSITCSKIKVMERGLSTLDIALKKEVHQSEKEDDNETLIDELEISPVIRKQEKGKYAEAEEEENEMNDRIYQEKPQPSPRKISTELARHKLQTNLERILSSDNCRNKDVISELTGSMTPTQVQKLIEKTNSELCRNNEKTRPNPKTIQDESVMKKMEKRKSCYECEEDEVIYKPSNLPYWTPQTPRKSSPQYPSIRRRLTDRYQRQSEIFHAHKQNQYFTPQVSRRKSEFHYFQESSDSDEEVQPPIKAQQLPRAKLPHYVERVKPIYLPNRRSTKVKAEKLEHRKTPLYSNLSHPVVPVNTGCQGCCHHHKKTNEDKSCILS